MAISTNGGTNPNEVIYNGKQCTEVWYKGSPSAEAVKVWPEATPIDPTYNFAYYSPEWSYPPAGFTLKAGGSRLLSSTQASGYPKESRTSSTTSGTANQTYQYDSTWAEGSYETIKTPYQKTTTTITTTSRIVSAYKLTYKDGDIYKNLPDKSGRTYTNIGLSFTCPSVGFDKDTYPEPYYFVPTFYNKTETTKPETITGKFYWAPTKVKNDRKILFWTNNMYSVYPVTQDSIPLYVPSYGSTYQYQNGSQGQYTALWWGPYSVSWSGKPNNLKIRADYFEQSIGTWTSGGITDKSHGYETWKPGTEYTTANGNFNLIINSPNILAVTTDVIQVAYSFVGTDSTQWSVYKNGTLLKTFTGEYTLKELPNSPYGTTKKYANKDFKAVITFSGNRIDITETVTNLSNDWYSNN